MKKEHLKNSTRLCLMIGAVYAWSGTGYLTWIYRLLNHYSEQTVGMFTNVIDYAFQAVGMLLLAFFVKKRASNLKKIFTLSIACEMVFMTAAVLIPVPSLSVISGLMMDVFCGMLFGCCFTCLASLPDMRGITMGMGWAIGSVASYLISIPGDGDFLRSGYSLFLYLIFAVMAFLLYREPVGKDVAEKQAPTHNPPDTRILVIALFTVILIEITRNMGFLFPISEFAEGTVKMEYSRAYYAVGLILAGIIADRSRPGGLLLCVCSLLCPFISLFLSHYTVAGEILWALNYALTGLLTVYGVVLFADLSENALYLAGLGLICRRIGEPVGATLGDRLAASPVILITLTSFAFVLSVFCSALLWKMLYFAKLPEENAALKKEPVNDEDSCLLFIKKYDLSARERDVLCEVIKGCSNPQIAENLFISENTVKFHMKNLLKKTGTSNRTDLIRLFNESNR